MTLPHSTNILLYPARFQFQSGAPCNGSSTCTDTCIQMIGEYYKDKTYSLSYIRRLAQAKTSYDERPCTGINYVEVLNALRGMGIYHYRVGWNVTYGTVAQKTTIGPVIVGVHYGSYAKYTSGRCGTTNRAEAGGKTDCGFRGAHAVLALRRVAHRTSTGKFSHYDFLMRDPDHHSASRREAPRYDRIKQGQLSTSMKNLVPYTAFRNTYIIYPTAKK